MNLRFPLRFKILVGLMLVVSIAIGSITISMTKLFHTDKTTYIYDLTSVMALNLAHQTESLVQSYLERLRVFTHIVMDKDLSRKSQSRLIQHLFEDFSDLV
ncbi:MAG: two-component sensor histidine kinase, partial [Gammaproteobacteria bacterium]|nr:two-component sensor histidine kinase [Gammaproteobacteria bacterium]